MVEVVLEGVSKYFGEVKAVDNVHLKVADREFLVLLGPSGSGKTTTMRLIAGLEALTAGKIFIGDRLVNDLEPRDRDVAMVFQSYALYPHMSVYDNLSFPLRMRKTPRNEVKERVKNTANLLQIAELLQRKPRQLSGGQQQRVALGRAIVRQPKVFLMDEPLSNLDAKLRLLMRVELKALQKKLGITTIYVTHDQVEAMSMGDRIAIMDKGALSQTAPPDEIYAHPVDTFVAGFIGSPPMNFVDCSLIEKEGKMLLDTTFCQIDVTDLGGSLKESIGDNVIVGIRPEHISVSCEKTTSTGFDGEIYVVEPLGSELILSVKVNEKLIKVKAPPSLKISPGSKVWGTFDVSKIHIFAGKTGKALV